MILKPATGWNATRKRAKRSPGGGSLLHGAVGQVDAACAFHVERRGSGVCRRRRDTPWQVIALHEGTLPRFFTDNDTGLLNGAEYIYRIEAGSRMSNEVTVHAFFEEEEEE